jgi:hypothetical protein
MRFKYSAIASSSSLLHFPSVPTQRYFGLSFPPSRTFMRLPSRSTYVRPGTIEDRILIPVLSLDSNSGGDKSASWSKAGSPWMLEHRVTSRSEGLENSRRSSDRSSLDSHLPAVLNDLLGLDEGDEVGEESSSSPERRL